VILSVGGQNGTVSVTDSASASEFASSVEQIIQQYGFDGVDIDLENGVNPAYMAQALEQLQSDVGSSLIITLAPQTIDTQSTASDYNSGTMNGCDGNVYAEDSVDVITALACTELQSGLSAGAR
jgi:chitinase